jgi:hypothetical protein
LKSLCQIEAVGASRILTGKKDPGAGFGNIHSLAQFLQAVSHGALRGI